MQNATLETKGTSTSYHVSDRIPDSLSDTSEQFTEMSTKASRLANDTKEAAGAYFKTASTWLQENYGKTIGALGFLAAIGTVAYILGRKSTQAQQTQSQAQPS